MSDKTKQMLMSALGFITVAAVYLIVDYLQNRYFPELEPTSTPTAQVVAEPGDYLRICSWNPQIFGDSKASNLDFMNFTADMFDDCDIAILQEIRDADSSSFWELCDMLQPEYNCEISSRAGESSSKEQYGFFYRDYMALEMFLDLNAETTEGYLSYRELWSRPPTITRFSLENTYGGKQ